MNPLLGFIEPRNRTQQQMDAHARALSQRVSFSLPHATLNKGEKIILTDVWKHPDVMADIGMEFTGFHQLTGSCVGASTGDAIFTLSGIQRLLADTPTVAFIPWWPFSYGRCRDNEGDSGQGEGAVDSIMGKTLVDEGVFDINQPGLPKFSTDDGFYLTSQLEMQWSDGRRIDQKWKDVAKKFPLGSAATLNNVQDILTGIVNGYPCLNGCSQYIGNGGVKGSGSDAYVAGRYDGSGGHSTCYLGAWNHPNDGMLYLYSNQWPTSTYPKDPAGGGRCCVWTPESEVQKLFSQFGGGDGETMALSHLTYLPAQPRVREILTWEM